MSTRSRPPATPAPTPARRAAASATPPARARVRAAAPAADTPSPAAVPVPAPAAPVAPGAARAPSLKLVRDSFTMPRVDHELIGILKDKTAGLKQPARKNELLRAGLHALLAMTPAQLLAAVAALTPVKSTRSRKRP